VPLGINMMQDQKSLTFKGHSFSRCGREHVASSFAYKGGQYLINQYCQPIATQVTHDTKPQIVDPPLTLTFRIGQGACLSFILIIKAANASKKEKDIPLLIYFDS